MILTINLAIAVPLLVLGVLALMGKGLSFFSGFRHLPNASADQLYRLEFGRAAGILLLGLGVFNIALGLAIHFKLTWLIWLSAIGMLTAAIYGLIRVFQINRKYGAVTKSGKIGTVIGLVAAAATLIVVAVLFIAGGAAPAVTVGDDSFSVSGMYGRTVSFSDINNVMLYERSMREIGIGTRTNGYGGAETLKGHFNSAEFGRHILFVRASASPTIRVEIEGGNDIFLSFDDAEYTRALYEELRAAVPRGND